MLAGAMSHKVWITIGRGRCGLLSGWARLKRSPLFAPGSCQIVKIQDDWNSILDLAVAMWPPVVTDVLSDAKKSGVGSNETLVGDS